MNESLHQVRILTLLVIEGCLHPNKHVHCQHNIYNKQYIRKANNMYSIYRGMNMSHCLHICNAGGSLTFVLLLSLILHLS